MAANQQDNTRPLHVHNEAPPTYSQHKKEVINIQLSYDLQAPTKPDLWNGFFHPIFLHGSIEHFALDFKSIQVSLDFLAKYIRNKQVNGNMINDLADFDGMGDAIWNFISSVYNAKWDTFYTDNKANTLRAKVSSKFTPRTIPQHNGNKKDIAKSVSVTINKVLPSHPLLAKTRKEINIIFKYFHPKKSSVENTAKGNNTSPRNQTY
ncbi:hypothetical protein Ac2012v2_007293 [Leucoagaricus gongylophorus]